METPEEYTIQEAAEACGLSVHTLRYYERIGLIHPISRGENSHRIYSRRDLRWIDFLLKLRRTGMPLKAMQRYAELQRMGDATLPERLSMLEKLRSKVHEEIAELHRHLDVIEYKIHLYRGLLAEGSGSSPDASKGD